MKYTTLLLLAICFIGCKGNTGKNADFGLQIMTIDSCEYVVYLDNSRGSVSMVHHGNCHNQKHNQ